MITGLAISHDAETLYSAAQDGTVLIWDLAGDRRLGRPFDVRPPSDGDALSRLPYYDPWNYDLAYALRPDGEVLAVGQRDGTVSLIDAETLKERSRFRAVPNAPVAWHGVRAGRAVARRRRRRRFPRHLRPGPRPSRHARCRATAAARC